MTMKTTRKSVDKREKDIKKKLSAAILMLLVSCIMVVTSTYAWFTLSTAPEVTGIHTTIGGNGNLEIALANGDTWADPTSVQTLSTTSGLTAKDTNVTWGNLVDVSEDYGVNLLSLTPAKLSLDDTGKKVSDNYLEVPKYGSDGRVSELTKGVLSAIYNGTAFAVGETENENPDRGLRALGISAAMTARQSAWMSALSDVTNYANSAKTGVSSAMQEHGATLGTVAVKLATSNDRNSEKFSSSDFAAIVALVTKTQTAASYIEDAIISAIDAAIASSLMQESVDDTTYSLISSALASDSTSISLAPGDGGTISVEGNDIIFAYTDSLVRIKQAGLATIINEYVTVAQKLNAASSSLTAVGEKTEYTWGDIDDAVNNLMDISNGELFVAGYSLDEVKRIVDEKDTAAILKIANNCVVELGANSGVFYTMANLVGTVKAKITMTVSAMGMDLEGVEATIQSTCESPIIPALKTVLNTLQPSSEGSDEANIISDRYGFILDLLFRTNAADSNLLLQTAPKDRIYSDNENADTMGGGSTMTFTKTVASFTDASMLKLINCIKLVFVGSDNTILATAGLDTGSTNGTPNYVVGADGSITANIRLFAEDGKTFLEDGSTITEGEDGTQTKSSNEQAICALTQNQAKAVSVLVYLDGEKVTNADVANAATSMSATINLQFASSAELEPMEYSGLHQTTTTTPGTGSGEQEDDTGANV